MIETVEYPDAIPTHGMKGVVVPKSLGRSQDDQLGQGVSDDTAPAIDLEKRIPMNIIEMDGKGNMVKAFVLDEAAQDRLRRANKTQNGARLSKPMSYEEAARVDPNKKTIEMVATSSFKRALTTEEKMAQEIYPESKADPIPEPQRDRVVQPSAALATDTENETSLIANHPRVKVKFSGAFGSIAVLYNLVHVHEDIQLVMLQYSADGQFNEAPSGDQQVLVEIDHQQYNCYPGPQVPLLPGSKLLITIYFIESEVGNGKER